MLLFWDFGLQSLGLLFLILEEQFAIQSLVVFGNLCALVLIWFDELLVELFVKLMIFDFVVGPVIVEIPLPILVIQLVDDGWSIVILRLGKQALRSAFLLSRVLRMVLFKFLDFLEILSEFLIKESLLVYFLDLFVYFADRVLSRSLIGWPFLICGRLEVLWVCQPVLI